MAWLVFIAHKKVYHLLELLYIYGEAIPKVLLGALAFTLGHKKGIQCPLNQMIHNKMYF